MSIKQNHIDKAVSLLKQGELVAMPTETVYGLAAAIDSADGIKKIFAVKKRPFFDPLIVHVSSLQMAKNCVDDWNEMAQLLAEKFWPGPLTLVLPKSKNISEVITSGLTSVGIRWPSHPQAQLLISSIGVPLAAPSANRFGKTSPTTAAHVKSEFADEVFVLDGDNSEIGIESTVLSVKKQNEVYLLAILRKGAVLKSQIDNVLKQSQLSYVWSETIDKKESPGHMKHHYMPDVPFVICRNANLKLSELSQLLSSKLKDLPDEVEGVKIIKPQAEIKRIEFLNLSKDPTQAAREVYAQLRAAAERKPDALCFIQTPQHQGELWESIFDRLYKAASLILD